MANTNAPDDAPNTARARGVDGAIGTDALVALFKGVDQPQALLAAFADGMAGLHDELGDLGRYLKSASAAGDWLAYGRAMRQLIDKYVRHVELDTPPPAAGDAERLRDLLRHTLGAALAALLRNDPALSDEAISLASGFRTWTPARTCRRSPGA